VGGGGARHRAHELRRRALRPPSTITRFGGTPIAAARAHEITAGYVRGFFDRFLRGRDGGPLGGEAPPEVRVRAYGRSTPGLSLRDCTVLDGAARARCGTFTVPEDRAAPGGRRIDLELVVVPAERPDPEPDPVFVLAGGPGQVATELTPLVQLLAGVHRDRDMVFVDQRGTGGSAPLLCPGAGEAPGEFGAAHDAYWDACLRELRRTADPRLYTTSAAVDDFDAVRAALGYDRVNLVGGSYGTRVAQVWLLRHPERVRSATLWAVAPADYDIPSGGGLAVQAAMQRLLAGCRADAACGAAFPRLGARLDSLLLALDRAPVEAGGVRITDELFAQTLLALLFDAEHLRRIPALVDRAARGEWERIAPVAAQVEAGGKEAPDALYLTVLCTEDVPRIRRARLAEFRGALGALLRESAEALQHRCARWPQGEPPAELRPPARSAVPVLLLSGETDPATPPDGGERALAYLANARHVEVPASSHGPIFPGCVKELVAEFIAHPDPARLDPGCVAEIRWRPFAVPEAAAGSGR
jgi:pimeloyl-ACP methyl ester carboxylesterase